MISSDLLMQGLTTGGIASFTLFCFTYYILPKIDGIQQNINGLRLDFDSVRSDLKVHEAKCPHIKRG